MSLAVLRRSAARRLRRAANALFYGWWIVLAGTSIEFMVGGLFTHAYGAYVVLLLAEFGWSATLLSLGFALVRMEHGLLGPFQGRLIDQYGPRAAVSVGVCLVAVGLLFFSQVSSLETFFAAVFVIGIGASLSGFSSLAVAIVNWFETRRSTALGIATLGNYAAPLFLPVVVLSFAVVGWRATAALSAVAVLLVAMPAAQLLRHRPEPPHMSGVEHSSPDTSAVRALAKPSLIAFTARGALGARQFWYLSFGHACARVVVSAVLVHLVPHLTGSLGFTLAEASTFVVVLSIANIIGALAGGAAGDRFARHHLVIASMGGHALGLLLLAYAAEIWMVVVFALVHGLAAGVRGPLMSAMRADFFGLTAYGEISGMSAMVVMLGNIVGPLAAGIAYDLTGSYSPGLILIAASACVGALFFALASRAAASTAALRGQVDLPAQS